MCKKNLKNGVITVKNKQQFLYIYIININISILTIIYTSKLYYIFISYDISLDIGTLDFVPSPFSLSLLHLMYVPQMFFLCLLPLSLYEYHDLNLIKHHNYLILEGQSANSLFSLTWPRCFIPTTNTSTSSSYIYLLNIIIYYSLHLL